MTALPLSLEVTLESPLVRGVGGPPVGDVDLDVTHDPENGAPFIPRQTLASRLRDSCLEVLAVWPDLGRFAPELLGVAGSTTTTTGDDQAGAALDIGTARPASTVLWALHERNNQPDSQPLPAAEVLDAFTVTLVSTAIDPGGAPRPHTRRAVRALRPGITLSADLTWIRNPSAGAACLLARCVLGLRQIGQGGNRGLGSVVCALDGDRDSTMRLAFPGDEP